MSTITDCLSQAKLGEAVAYKNLAMFPLFSGSPFEADYLLLDEALAAGTAKVTEISESGSVPELKFVNDGNKPVLLVDGEELVGAKQNRILNLSVMVPAGQTINIPVSCVEAGRWHSVSNEFQSVKRAHFAEGRARKARSVSASMSYGNTRRSDQSEVWGSISDKMCRMSVDSPTSAASELYESRREKLEDYLAAFKAVEGQVGALFTINGKAIGFDLFDSPATCETILPKLVQSYAVDAIERIDPDAKADRAEADALIEDAIKAIEEQFPAVGLGRDIRLKRNKVAGGALVVDERVVHLCVFRTSEPGSDRQNGNESRMQSRTSRIIGSRQRRRSFLDE